MMKKYINWILSIYIAFVFIQSLFYKFTGSVETDIIFSTIGNWMKEFSLLNPISDFFIAYGGVTVGSTELIAASLVLYPSTRLWGAIVGLCIMSGAIFFHLFTPLGVDRIVDTAGNTDGGVLFYLACGVWISCCGLIFLNIDQLKMRH